MKYNPSLDGMRAVAILAVLVHHFTYSIYAGGALGVDVFFALSGYLITTILLVEIDRTGRVDYGAFYMRRVRRLAPALACALVLAGALWHSANTRTPFSDAAVPAIFYYENWVGVYHEERLGTLAPMWSLSVEEQFYLAWPLALGALLFVRRGRTRFAVASVMAFAAIAVLVVARAVLYVSHSPFANYYSSFSRADEILAGALLAAVQQCGGGHLSFFASRRGAAVAWTASLVVVAATLFVGPLSPSLYFGGFSAVAWCAGLAIAHIENAKSGLLARLLAQPLLVAIGKRSYGIYLYHMPVFAAFEYLHVRHSVANLILLVLLRTAVVLTLAWASYRFVECPFLRARHRVAAPAPQ